MSHWNTCEIEKFKISTFLFQTGLTEACRQSKVTTAEAEAQLMEFMMKYTEPGVSRSLSRHHEIS
jgi:oligoribonuclease (3'-5' exoribonuclease)